ncbi:hypothetical protein JQ628_05375 [Bradyrhizobium lablabi]|uniref:hypothetical protein n=1 Tax=Bradyrhizobium lablabi TaxID=722472 RepID=UPI001BA4B5EF|nr:hypothetical protein [Bradyrhizobium lablabi]MBR1120939.1 hypothetical protein [Bradyrhizobium lablabi]
MSELAAGARRKGSQAVWVWLLVACGVIALVAANAHLVYVASTSQPACVEHLRDAGALPGQYRAAKSSCSPAAGASQEGQPR